MKTVNVTYSIPEYINILLHTFVEKRQLSKFVAKAIEKALEEEKNTLKAAFKEADSEAKNDPELKDWIALDGEDWDA